MSQILYFCFKLSNTRSRCLRRANHAGLSCCAGVIITTSCASLAFVTLQMDGPTGICIGDTPEVRQADVPNVDVA